jgi:hypothetical protein
VGLLWSRFGKDKRGMNCRDAFSVEGEGILSVGRQTFSVPFEGKGGLIFYKRSGEWQGKGRCPRMKLVHFHGGRLDEGIVKDPNER